MIDYNIQFANLLEESNVDVYYDLFSSRKNIPCVSYLELSNIDELIGDTISYSHLAYQVRIFSDTINEANNIASLIDTSVKTDGFNRTYSTDTIDSETNKIIKILRYEANAYERA